MRTIPFDYEKYKNEGYEVVCRDGRKVEEVHLFEPKKSNQPLVAVVDGHVHAYYPSGVYTAAHVTNVDLFLVAKPVERWMNVYRNAPGYFFYDTYLKAEGSFDKDRYRIAILRLTFSDETLSELLTSTPVAL